MVCGRRLRSWAGSGFPRLFAWLVCALNLEVSARTLQEQTAQASRAQAIYQRQCALCHGSTGKADGPASYLLFPPARDFSSGRFKVVSTVNGVPTDQDLIAILRRGMPGSAMPSWNELAEKDLEALAGYVRELSVAGMAERLESEVEGSEQELLSLARERMTPGAPLDVGQPAQSTSTNLELGQRLFLAQCAECHGEDGRGRPDRPRPNRDATLNYARDLTAGILKGGASHEELARRIHAGVHGTAMPGSDLSREERSALIAFLRSLIPPGAEDRLVQRRQRIPVKRVEEGVLESGVTDVDWQQVGERHLVLAPLWWQEGAILQTSVSALHDGKSIALRIRWADPTVDTPTDLEWPLDAPQYTDGVACQLSIEQSPAFFGMGEGHSVTNLWHWRAIDLLEVADFMTLQEFVPHRFGEWSTEEARRRVPLYQIANGPLHVAGEAVSVTVSGRKTLEQQESLPPSIAATPSWHNGGWDVVFQRSLQPRSERELSLQPGSRVSINFAIWNGSIKDLRGQKSVTIWHALELEP